jgi:ABC-2 type transport system permease protein
MNGRAMATDPAIARPGERLMGRDRRALGVAFWTASQRAVAERGGIAVSVLFYAIVISVLSGVWRVAAAANGGAIVGYSAVALTWYIATSEATTLALNARLIDEVGTDIASGAIAVELLRPASVLWLRVASELGRALPRLVVIAPVGVGLATLTAGGPPHLGALALAVPSIAVALAANVVAQHVFAASAFWVRSAGSAWFLYQKLVFVLGGMLIPLEVFPGWLETTARFLPFRAMAYAPARLASGHLEPLLLLEQMGWLALLAFLSTVVFRRGERHLQVVGG